jgi:DNA-directed RNA polymerase subunit RPC12/RpoP
MSTSRGQFCGRCGYELQGMRSARCPECGAHHVLSAVRDRRLARVSARRLGAGSTVLHLLVAANFILAEAWPIGRIGDFCCEVAALWFVIQLPRSSRVWGGGHSILARILGRVSAAVILLVLPFEFLMLVSVVFRVPTNVLDSMFCISIGLTGCTFWALETRIFRIADLKRYAIHSALLQCFVPVASLFLTIMFLMWPDNVSNAPPWRHYAAAFVFATFIYSAVVSVLISLSRAAL